MLYCSVLFSFQAERYNYVHKTAIRDSWIWCRSWRSNIFSAADMSSWPPWHLILLVHHRELRDFHFAASALLICLPLCSSKPRPKVSALLWRLPRTTGYRVPTPYAPSMLPSILLILFFFPPRCVLVPVVVSTLLYRLQNPGGEGFCFIHLFPKA